MRRSTGPRTRWRKRWADPLLLAIDQGTTSTRAILFDRALRPLAGAQRALPQIYPDHGWIEHDPEAIWSAVLATGREAVAGARERIAALGITNQRETVVLWERDGGRPIYNAIVWQDRRTAARCRDLAAAGHEAMVAARSGLVLDPYFSATKIAWILDHTGTRRAAERGEIAFGTIDSFLLWRLTEGRVHATDATNASRTALYDIHDLHWNAALLALFGVPEAMLPEVRDTTADYGVTEAFGPAIPIAALAGDQQAALAGHACFAPGDRKCTYGTGAFLIGNTGTRPVASSHRLLTTIAWRIAGRATYALEGSIFVTGAAMQWLRDGLGVLDDVAESAVLAASVPDSGGVFFVPALSGLGAPWWDAEARGLICGIERGTTRAHLVRAALEAVCLQTCDLLDAMAADGLAGGALRVDGGMTRNPWLLQCLADLTGEAVQRAAVDETTALGTAALAGLQAGVFASFDDVARRRAEAELWQPAATPSHRAALRAGWRRAVQRTR